MTPGPTPLVALEMLLVAAGALLHAHLWQARSRGAKELWFNVPLLLWNLSWTIWYGLTLFALNLETVDLWRFPVVSMLLDVVKGALINLQAGFLLHGLARWSRVRLHPAVWYVVPLGIVVAGFGPVTAEPMHSFLRNIDALVLPFLAADIAACLLGALLLRRSASGGTGARTLLNGPLRRALVAMAVLLAIAAFTKWRGGGYMPGKYRWVLYFDLAHLLAPAALLATAYRSHTVALEVTRASFSRIAGLGLPFLAYLGFKLLWPGSTMDRAATYVMAPLCLLAVLGPLTGVLLGELSRRANLRLQRETRVLEALEARLRSSGAPPAELAAYAARCLGRILSCRCRVLAGDDPAVADLLGRCGVGPGERPRLLSHLRATSRSAILAWEGLGARLLLPVWPADPDARWPDRALLVGPSRKASRFPAEVVAGLRAVQGVLQQAREARDLLDRALESERRLQEGERLAMLGMLSATTAHEIKNPLSAIRNVASAALRDAPDGSLLRQDLAVVVGEVDRLDATVRRMLHLARDRGRCDDARETAAAVVGLLRADAEARGIALALDLPGSPVPVPLSENDLKAVLFNLLLNALEHAPRGSEVAVRFPVGNAALEVGNAGTIPDSVRSRLFLPMASREGNGLGLYISRRKAREAGGDLVFRDEPGRTVFRLSWEKPPTPPSSEGSPRSSA